MLSAGLGHLSPVGRRRAMQAPAAFMRASPRCEIKSKMGMNPCSVCSSLAERPGGRGAPAVPSAAGDAAPAPRWLLQQPLVLNPTGRGENKLRTGKARAASSWSGRTLDERVESRGDTSAAASAQRRLTEPMPDLFVSSVLA